MSDFSPTPDQIRKMKASGNHNAKIREEKGKLVKLDCQHGTNPFKQLSKSRYLFERYDHTKAIKK